MSAAAQFRVDEVSPSCWRVTFDNGPVNLLDPDTVVIRGRARGAGSEFVLATDIRFASEKAVLGQFEVGVGAVPGGGPMARLGHLAGRGRALEILLGGDDIPGALAAEYGYVNRVIPDGQIEGFTDAFARRIAAFDKVAVAGIKKLADVAALPENQEFAPALQAYFATAGRPENQPFTQLLLENGLQRPDGIETHLGTAIGRLRQDASRREAGGHPFSSTRQPTG